MDGNKGEMSHALAKCGNISLATYLKTCSFPSFGIWVVNKSPDKSKLQGVLCELGTTLDGTRINRNISTCLVIVLGRIMIRMPDRCADACMSNKYPIVR